jgi:hypothetical protein
MSAGKTSRGAPRLNRAATTTAASSASAPTGSSSTFATLSHGGDRTAAGPGDRNRASLRSSLDRPRNAVWRSEDVPDPRSLAWPGVRSGNAGCPPVGATFDCCSSAEHGRRRRTAYQSGAGSRSATGRFATGGVSRSAADRHRAFPSFGVGRTPPNAFRAPPVQAGVHARRQPPPIESRLSSRCRVSRV